MSERSSMLEKHLTTVNVVDTALGESVYSFDGVIRYHVDPGDELTIDEFVVEGDYVEGRDLGHITYTTTEPWPCALNPDRTFVARGVLAWSDDTEPASSVAATLRGTLLDTHELAFITFSMRHAGAEGELAGTGGRAMQIPASW